MIKKLNSLTILFIITAVMVLLMLFTVQRPSDTSEDYSLLFPDLFEQLNNVDTIKIKSNQDEFTLYKEGEDWYIKERWNYLADFNLVKRAMIDIAEAKILERKTDNPQHHVLLGVEGDEEGGSSILVTMLSGEQKTASLIVGSERELGQTSGPRQFYVRRSNEDRAWLSEGYLNINPLMLNWIKSEVINIERERIAQVNIIQPNGDTATIVNLGKKDKFGVPEMMENTVFKYKQLGYDIAGSLFQLRMEDVQPLSDFSRGEAEVVKAEFITFDGLKVTVDTSFDDGFYYSTFRADYDQSAIKEASEDIQQLDVLKTPEQVQKEVAILNKQLAAWVYRFGGFVGTNLMRAESDIVTKANQTIPMPADLTGFGP
ncbi:MAG: DUF4340 domain-containing protein [Gammaproteobacteria bacterium]|nr:DUF4340 domain-containing protein [Gammaproteobacteria bacterium]MDH5592626.1 DUF4340 domain-containing protein [Gammaproteobacteria bacterium]